MFADPEEADDGSPVYLVQVGVDKRYHSLAEITPD